MRMEPERMDLSALDPTRDQLRYERMVRRIVDAAEPELRRRAMATTPLGMVAGWARPTMAAAAIITILAGGAIFATERSTPEPLVDATEALGLPAPASDWLIENREPTEEDLVLAMEARR
ncbi:MAG TPA: hypothetical protein VK966_05100 [Longimicrobiales bacterium]|nr:hypothetical protein [Longimicrobiales bacterium]